MDPSFSGLDLKTCNCFDGRGRQFELGYFTQRQLFRTQGRVFAEIAATETLGFVADSLTLQFVAATGHFKILVGNLK